MILPRTIYRFNLNNNKYNLFFLKKIFKPGIVLLFNLCVLHPIRKKNRCLVNLQNQNIDAELIIRYLQNDTSKDEVNKIYRWIEESPANKELFDKFKNIWEATGKISYTFTSDIEKQWKEIEKKINSENQKTVITEKDYQTKLYRNHQKGTSWLMWSFRAAALILIGFSLYWLSLMYQEPVEIESTLPEKIFYEAVTRKGEKLTIKLADGSTVYMNAESKLVYPRYFEDEAREVMLSGEAYFDVKSITDQPYRVVTGSMINEVKGTTFNVKYRKNLLEVVVTEGSVMMKNHNGSITLKKGEYGSFTEKTGFNNQKRVDISHFLAWRYNKLSFKGTPLTEAMEQVELYFNVNVDFANDNTKSKKITGYFDAESLDEVLESVELAMDVTFVKKGRNIFVY